MSQHASVDHSSPAGIGKGSSHADQRITTGSSHVMGAGGAFEVSPITQHMTKLAGRDFNRNNPVRDKDQKQLLSRQMSDVLSISCKFA